MKNYEVSVGASGANLILECEDSLSSRTPVICTVDGEEIVGWVVGKAAVEGPRRPDGYCRPATTNELFAAGWVNTDNGWQAPPSWYDIGKDMHDEINVEGIPGYEVDWTPKKAVAPAAKESEGLDIRNGILYGLGDCTSSRIVIPYGVTAIANRAFYGCRRFSEIVIPDTVTEIGAEAFYGCYSLRRISFGTGVKNIGVRAFVSTPLEEVDLSSVLFVDMLAFAFCTDLNTIRLGETTETDESAFTGCHPATVETGLPSRHVLAAS